MTKNKDGWKIAVTDYIGEEGASDISIASTMMVGNRARTADAQSACPAPRMRRRRHDMSDERKGWTGTMEKVNACGHTNAQHMYYEEKVLELDGAACPLVQAAILAERERCAKIAGEGGVGGIAAKEGATPNEPNRKS